jgi:imidazoleglycerol-phosphate dehydratase
MKEPLKRETKETCIELSLDLEGSGKHRVETGIELLDYILTTFSSQGKIDLSVSAIGDLVTGDHHTVEDVGITLGTALARLNLSGTGSSIVPSEDGFALAAVRFGKPGYSEDISFKAHEVGGMALENMGHFARALAYNGRFTLHLSAKGDRDLTKVEALSAALGRAIKKAFQDSSGT